MTYTVHVGIGNSDDRLTQGQWSRFWRAVDRAVRGEDNRVHFSGQSMASDPWQNAMWVVELSDAAKVSYLREWLDRIRVTYNQNSIAWLCVRSDQLEFIVGGDSGTS